MCIHKPCARAGERGQEEAKSMPTAEIGESMTVVAQQLDASSSAHPELTSTSGDGGNDGAGGAREDGEQAAEQAASRGHNAEAIRLFDQSPDSTPCHWSRPSPPPAVTRSPLRNLLGVSSLRK